MKMEIQNNEKNPCAQVTLDYKLTSHDHWSLTRNSFVPDDSLLISKCDFLGVNVINALSFFDDFDRYGFDT